MSAMRGLCHLPLTWSRKTAWPALLALVLTGCATGSGGSAGARVPPLEPDTPPVSLDVPPELVIEVVVTGRDGRPVEAMSAADFEVTVDGRRRAPLSIARLYRGPGADVMATHTITTPGELHPLSEHSRTVVIAVDQASLLPGEERAAREAAETCMNLLGISDQIGVVALPINARTQIISFDRTAARETLSRLRAAPLAAAASTAAAGTDEEEAARNAAAGRAETDRREAGREDPARAAASEAARAAAKSHAVSTLDSLARILHSLEPVPGGKTVLFLSGGLVAADADTDLRATIDAAARAHTRIVSLRLPTASPLRNGAPDLQRLASEAGGRLVTVTGRPQQALAQVAEQLSLSYLLLLPPAPGDGDPAPHAVRVQVPRRKDLSIWAPALAARGLLRREQLVAALLPPAVEATGREEAEPSVRRTAPGASRAPVFRHEHDVDLVLARASQYVDDYGPVLSAIVSEERYVQESTRPARTTTIRSDFLTVRIEGSDGWVPFRDVFEVNGEPVRDREDRLTRLFIDRPSPERLRERRDAIMRENARYNVGTVFRTLNVPTIPLWFLEPASTRRFAFRKTGEESLDGRKLWVLEYTETVWPTFITTSDGRDVPAWGKVWVDPLNGTVHKTELHASVAVVTVTYGRWPGLPGVWLPLHMKERYTATNLAITAEATYTNFRQFRVTTQQEIRLPKR